MSVIQLAARHVLGNWTIGTRLKLGFGLLLLFIVGLSITGLTNVLTVQQTVDRALSEGLEIEALGSRVQKALFAARRQEQGFLLHWQAEGYQDAVNTYLIPHGNQLTDIRLAVAELEELTASGSRPGLVEINADLVSLRAALQTYRDEFNLVTSLLGERGTNTSGVVGELEQISLLLENNTLRLSRADLISTYLELRLHENQYRLLGERYHSYRVSLSLQDFRAGLAELPPDEVGRIGGLLDRYEATFDRLVSLDAEISRHTELYTAAADRIQPLAVKIAARGSGLADQDLASVTESAQKARLGFLLMMAVSVALGSLLSVSLTRQISRPLQALTDAAIQIGRGNLRAPLPTAGHDEVGVLADTFRDMVAQLQESFATLEERVAARTQRLEIVARLSERLSAILDLETLLAELVNQIKDSFGYYHAHIYLLDDARETLIMAEGTGEAGRQMKARGHKIARNAATSLVARAARSGQVVWVDNVREASDWLPNPLLPDTYCEMAIPIVLAGQVVGVLDVQQDRIGGLDEADANMLRSLANQVAVAMNNARLFQEMQASLREIETLNQTLTHEAWQDITDKIETAGYVFAGEDVRPAVSPETWLPVMSDAVRRRALVQGNGQGSEPEGQPTSLAIPLTLRGEIIGVIGIERQEDAPSWSEDELVTLKSVTEQIALALESARLADETERTAWRDRLVSDVTREVWTGADLEQVMQAAVTRLGQELNVSEVVLRLGADDNGFPAENGQEADR